MFRISLSHFFLFGLLKAGIKGEKEALNSMGASSFSSEPGDCLMDLGYPQWAFLPVGDRLGRLV